jgi:hypothetical protein
MLKQLFFLIFFLAFYPAFSQYRIALEGDLGVSIPAHHDLKDLYNAGLNISLGPSFFFNDEKVSLKPAAGLKWYYKEVEDVNSVTEHIRTWKAGLEGRYMVLKKNDFSLSPILRVDYNWLSNYYSETYEHNFITNTSTSASSANLLEGKSFSVTTGLMARNKNLYFKLDNEFFSPKLQVNEAILTSASAQGVIVEPSRRFNFSSLTVSVGYLHVLR